MAEVRGERALLAVSLEVAVEERVFASLRVGRQSV